jgi:hypothetical protein
MKFVERRERRMKREDPSVKVKARKITLTNLDYEARERLRDLATRRDSE